MDRIKRDTLLGFVFFGTLGFLLWATVNLTDLSLSEKIDVYFPQAGSCDVGTNVMVLGKKIGKVGAIDIQYDRADTPVRMQLLLREKIPLRDGHLIEVRDDGVLGGKQIYIDPGKGAPLADGAALLGIVAGSAFDKLGDIADGKGAVGESLNSTLTEVGDFFRNMNDPETSIGRMATRRELYDSVLSTFNNANRIFEAVTNAEGAVGTLIMNKQTAEDTTTLLANLRTVSDNLLATDGPLGVLLNDQEAARDLQGILDNVDRLIADSRDGKGMLGRILTDDKLAGEFASIVANLNTVLQKANDPNAGALGAITSDPEMAKHLKETIANANMVSEQLTQRKGLLGVLINDEDLAVRFRRILTQVSRAIEDAREAAPISNFVQVLLGTF
ncbi:MAG: phospholipid/cholesterol/gamma-HCH transport system substrate-binding protein [Hyphomicrobiaceae bacterium]|jgi:phospholipid/cholesterol/gamma-HCH transport system substrate-binding protein